MSAINKLRRRLESAETIRQISDAMRSAATAKYTRLSAALDAFSPYAREIGRIRDAACESGEDAETAETTETNADAGDAGASLYVLVSGNRGMCGGYHHDLFSYFSADQRARGATVATCGKKAYEYCVKRKIPVEKSFDVPDIPGFDAACEIAGYARELYSSGRICRLFFCYQRFFNMIRSEPRTDELFPGIGCGSGGETLFIPDRASVTDRLAPAALAAGIYEILLSSQTAAQAATLTAMRAAYENADKSIASLQIMINRLRQSEVTASVLETATDVENDG